jgi:hypothetical protein
VSDHLFKVLTKKTVKDDAPQFQNLHVNFHNFHALLSTRLSQLRYAIIISSVLDEFRKCSQVHIKCRGWAWAWALAFIEQYHNNGNEFFNHIIQVTGHETWISFVNDKTNEQ